MECHSVSKTDPGVTSPFKSCPGHIVETVQCRMFIYGRHIC